ncbi:MAG TPA: transglycosylase SLT domain-containing protein [Casimicrobiaceae bacterium]|nr:transglycosylase SLT domain-containing protein [Casimicrobiaceae bacterium]
MRMIVLLLACALVTGVDFARADADTDFLAAKQAYELGDARRFEAATSSLNGYVLEPYVLAWRLKLSLDSVDPTVVRAYLARFGGTPPAEQLRVDWLRSLATKQQWDLFGQEVGATNSDDVELACHSIVHRRMREGDAVLANAKPLWFSGRASPDACEPLFAALLARGTLSLDDRRARLRLAIETGNVRLAQAIGSAAPPPLAIPDVEFGRVERDPLGALARGQFAWKDAGGRELALFALDRAARRDVQTARAAWVKMRGLLPERDRNYGNARLAFHAARALQPDANLYFREAGTTSLNEDGHAWRVRAALRALSWRDVNAAIEAMPASQRDESAWRYWRARALDALGSKEEARRILVDLSREYHFYGLLAAELVGSTHDLSSRPVAPSDTVLAGFGARSDVKRAVKLAQLDLRVESAREWGGIVRGFNDEGLLVAAEFARRQGLVDRAINLAERTSERHDFAMRYQTPFRSEFEAAARAHDTDVALLFAIARQESRFSPDIVSSAGAQGLMQLMPATARWIAKQLGETGFKPSRVTDIDLNTRFGAFYFRHCLERLDNHPALAAAAYNAGPGRAQAWRPVVPLEGAIWVETIPFNETRDYVKKVLANAMFYTRTLGKPVIPLTTRLATVTPRQPGGGTVAVAN